MVEMQLGDQRIRYDRDATAEIYASSRTGWAERCGCAGCRNYLAQRDEIYPPLFKELLDRLGIDLRKEAEVVADGPLKSGLHHYGGWFFFVGEALTPSDSWEAVPGTQVKMRQHQDVSEVRDSPYFAFFFTGVGPRPKEFRGVKPRFAIEFEAHFEWVLPETWDSDLRSAAGSPSGPGSG
jgi:hypothetical protein